MLLVNTWFKRSLDIILFCKEQGDPGRREFQASVPLGLENGQVDISISFSSGDRSLKNVCSKLDWSLIR